LVKFFKTFQQLDCLTGKETIFPPDLSSEEHLHPGTGIVQQFPVEAVAGKVYGMKRYQATMKSQMGRSENLHNRDYLISLFQS